MARWIDTARPWLETANYIGQMSLVVVAIFGYFYTVRPIYQKERLAEQVAEYEGIISQQKPKIAEMQVRLADLQRERESATHEAMREREKLSQEATRDRVRLTAELNDIQRQLAAAREQKSKIEGQTQFMIYRYRLPDGSPAITPEQVKVAQVFELKQSFLSSLSTTCTYGLDDYPFSPYSNARTNATDKPTDKQFPFTEQELAVWKQYGAKYPLKRAIECIDSVTAKFSQRYGQNLAAEIDSLRKDAVDHANRAAVTPWSPPAQPDDVLRELAAKRAAIVAEKAAALKQVEDQYGGWESIILPDRRAIYKNNYVVGKQNAAWQAASDEISLEWKTRATADLLRKSIQEEIRRLILSDSTTPPK